MANRTTNVVEAQVEVQTPVSVEPVIKELNLDEKVTVKNIAGWNVGFARRADGYGDVLLAPNGSLRLSRNEIIAQVQSGNKLFTGIDGIGTHATIYINDAATRREVGFDTDEASQVVFCNLDIKKLFSIKNKAEFESKFAEAIYTRAEKYAVMEAMKKENINDYAKIRFAESHTGYKY